MVMDWTTFYNNSFLYFVVKEIIVLPSSVFIFLSSLIAVLAIIRTHRLALLRNTIDFEVHYLNKELEEAYVLLYDAYDDSKNNGNPMKKWGVATNFNEPKSKAIRKVINTWERVGRGVKNGIYSDKVLYNTYYTTLVKVDSYTKDYRLEVQKISETYFKGFEELCSRWKRKKRIKLIFTDLHNIFWRFLIKVKNFIFLE